MIPPTRTPEGKVVVVECATGYRFERWPVDARDMIESGCYIAAEDVPADTHSDAAQTADAPDGTPGDSPAAPVNPAPESPAPLTVDEIDAALGAKTAALLADRRAPLDEQPIALAVAEEAGTLPDEDRRREEAALAEAAEAELSELESDAHARAIANPAASFAALKVEDGRVTITPAAKPKRRGGSA